MTLSEAQAWAVIITAVGGAAISILAAVQTRTRLHETQGSVMQVRQQVQETEGRVIQVRDKLQETQGQVIQVGQQVEEVYQLTDKKLTEQQALFEQLYGRIGALTKEGLGRMLEPAQ
jgi:hypothetical protein